MSAALLAALELGDPVARAEACAALAALAEADRPPGALGTIARAVRDPEAAVRRAACRALGYIGDTRAVDPLLSAFGDDDHEVRGAATAALIAIGDARALARDALGLGADGGDATGDPRTRLHWVMDLDALDRLSQVIRARGDGIDGGAGARTAACYALGALGAVAAAGVLVEALRDHAPAVRAAAAFSLGILGEGWVAPALVAAAEDEDPRVELEVIGALATLAAPEGESVLMAAARHRDDDVKALAAVGLGRLARGMDAGAGGALRAALSALSRDRGTSVRRAVATALGQLGVRAQLLAMLSDPAQIVRETAAAGLARDRRALGPELETLLASGDADARRGAAYGLGRLGGPGAAAALAAAAAADRDDRVRAAAAFALADRAGSEAAARGPARETLLALLGDGAWSLRAAAAEGLRRLADVTSVPALRRAAAEDAHPAVRQAAETALRAFSGVR